MMFFSLGNLGISILMARISGPPFHTCYLLFILSTVQANQMSNMFHVFMDSSCTRQHTKSNERERSSSGNGNECSSSSANKADCCRKSHYRIDLCTDAAPVLVGVALWTVATKRKRQFNSCTIHTHIMVTGE